MINKDLVLTQDTEGQSFSFSDLLYHSRCGKCEEKLIQWRADFDADGCSYWADCYECIITYYITPNTYQVHMYHAETGVNNE